MKLIEAEKVEKITFQETMYSDPINVLTDVRDKVRALPAVDAEPVRHGKWIYSNDFYWYTASCNKCGHQRRTDIKADGWNQWNYCPNCGAKMDRLISAETLKLWIDNCGCCGNCKKTGQFCYQNCDFPDSLTDEWERAIDEQPTVEAIPIEWLENFRDGLDTLSENRLMHAIDLIINAYRAEKKRKEE